MSKDQEEKGEGNMWEGWEASEERLEEMARSGLFMQGEEDDDHVGVLWMGPPHPQGLAGVQGGIPLTTPKGRKIKIGLPPGMLSEQGLQMVAAVADRIADQIDEAEKNPDHHNRVSWLHTVRKAVHRFDEGEDPESLWKIASILHDFEMISEQMEEKGYPVMEEGLEVVLTSLPDLETLLKLAEMGVAQGILPAPPEEDDMEEVEEAYYGDDSDEEGDGDYDPSYDFEPEEADFDDDDWEDADDTEE